MSNYLAHETSPYLLQHANNPVDWHPWGEEALAIARRENKPILLSIGYASCHWCHVMAHESFEDEETARLMNQLFVNIKVDREERPDLDKIYQTAHALLTQRSGGWPLTVFLSPDNLVPFFAGTYFPREPRYQLPAFKEVLQTIANIYQNSSDDIKDQGIELMRVMNSQSSSSNTGIVNKKPLELAEVSLSQIYDPEFGGFDGAPKFPRPTAIEFLLKSKSEMALNTLRHMAQGGICDQLEGGFFRYSVDEKWLIPHFEKMLYDNGQLLFLFSMAAKSTHEEIFSQAARDIGEWALTKMEAPQGGYYSSLDADTEGHEGKFYVWNKFEIDELLNNDEAQLAGYYYGLHEPANFEHMWHLHVAMPLDQVAKKLNILPGQAQRLLMQVKQKLLAAREKRPHPACDNKILTSWNALMIKGMLAAGDVLHEPRFTASAHKALEFIRNNLWVNERLLAMYKPNKTPLPAYLDDYAFLLDALMMSLKISWDKENLNFASQLAKRLLDDFSDKNVGGFFFTAEDQEKVLYRPKTFSDDSSPSGNSVAVRALLTLSDFLGDTSYRDAAEKTLRAAWPMLSQYPREHCNLLLGLKEFLEPPMCMAPGCGIY